MMKRFVMIFCLIVLATHAWTRATYAAETEFDVFLKGFNYEVRDEMKIDSKGLLPLLTTGKAVLVDVRFVEEVEAWRVGYARNIPLNELPGRIKELPKDKIIVAACPHRDRSAIAMTYLRSKGYNAKYLTDGLIGLAEFLRGERAKDYIEDMNRFGQGNPSIKTK
jgi:rhodanese-related sulfurtransferase